MAKKKAEPIATEAVETTEIITTEAVETTEEVVMQSQEENSDDTTEEKAEETVETVEVEAATEDIPEAAKRILKLFYNLPELYITNAGRVFTPESKPSLRDGAILYKNPFYNSKS